MKISYKLSTFFLICIINIWGQKADPGLIDHGMTNIYWVFLCLAMF